MMRSLYLRSLYDRRWFLAGWAAVFTVMTTLILTFYPSFSDTQGFETIAGNLPDQLKGFIGDPSVFRTLDGFIATQIYDIRMPLLIIIMSLILAAGLTVREEENGDLRTLLTTKLSRERILFEKFLAGSTIVILLNLVAVGGTYIGVIMLGETLPHELIWRLFALSSLFGAAAFSIPFAIGMASGKRSLTMLIGLIVAVGSYLLTTFSKAVEWLQDYEWLSLMHHYHVIILRTGHFERTDIWVLGGVIITMGVISLLVFRHRDIN